MGIPNPPKRKDRKAIQYVEELQAQALIDPALKIEEEDDAQRYAWALIVVALFGEEERALFREVYDAYAQGECLEEVRDACACGEKKDQLCLILDRIVAEGQTRRMAAYMAEILEQERWRPIRQMIEDRKFKADNFVWWRFDPDQQLR
jgi:hypothetical protein